MKKKMRKNFDPSHAELGQAEQQSQLRDMFRKYNLKENPELFKDLSNWKKY